MLPTPSTDHVSFNHTYEPAEDSFLLLDTLSSQTETAFLTNRFRCSNTARHRAGMESPGRADEIKNNDNAIKEKEEEEAPQSPSPIVMEVGVGSGVILAFIDANASALFGRPDIFTIGTDVNPFACLDAIKNVSGVRQQKKLDHESNTQTKNSISPMLPIRFQGIIQADLASPLRAGTVDVLVCNPPYVPTSELPALPDHAGIRRTKDQKRDDLTFEQDTYLLSLSYAGGEEGMQVTNRLLSQLPEILSYPLGIAYILLCAQNKPDLVKGQIGTWGGDWRADTVRRSGKQGGWEKLQVIRVWRN